MKRLFICSVLALCFSGCALFKSTTPTGRPETWASDENGMVLNRIPGTQSVEIPAQLTDSQALDAVELAINGTNPGERNNSWVSKWRPEMRDPQNRWIRIGLHVRQHYLCVCYRVEGHRLVPDVPTSTNLNQNGIRIHRKVPTWINNFNTLITMQMYGLANGQTCIGTKASTRNRVMQAEARQAEALADKAEAEVSRAAVAAGKPLVKTVSIIGLDYDPDAHRGTIRVRFPEGRYGEARQKARNHIEALARDKGAMLRTGETTSSALYSIGAERVKDGVLEMEFTTE